MNDGDKTLLKENREQLKTIKDAIRYQKLLLSAENKVKNKERIKYCQSRKKHWRQKSKSIQ